MLETSAQRILERLQPTDLVLDLGGWGRPFTRADWVMDLMPYETRGLYGHDGPREERFTERTWLVRDLCDREPYPFADKQFDFVVCSHTLEDVRDPLWVCSEMIRVAKAGYVEVPSRLEEQAYGFQGPWAGWGHHRWLIDICGSRVEFVFKHHVLHNRKSDHFPKGFRDTLAEERTVQTLFWEGSFGYQERVFVYSHELDPYLADYVTRHRRQISRPWLPWWLRRTLRRGRRAAGGDPPGKTSSAGGQRRPEPSS